MFIPVSLTHPSNKPSEFIADEHVSLEVVRRFFIRLGRGGTKDQYVVEAGEQEHWVTKETYDLLKSLVLRP